MRRAGATRRAELGSSAAMQGAPIASRSFDGAHSDDRADRPGARCVSAGLLRAHFGSARSSIDPMKKSKSALVSAAVAGLFLGTASTSLTSCASGSNSSKMEAQMDKHACKGMNACKGQGGCKSGDNGCGGKNSCKGKGGCATAAHHACKGMNACKGQGGCKSGDNGCGGKNSCKGKGGCAVPVKH